jgi:hypothetical protein
MSLSSVSIFTLTWFMYYTHIIMYDTYIMQEVLQHHVLLLFIILLLYGVLWCLYLGLHSVSLCGAWLLLDHLSDDPLAALPSRRGLRRFLQGIPFLPSLSFLISFLMVSPE